jgi:hypothetical protein
MYPSHIMSVGVLDTDMQCPAVSVFHNHYMIVSQYMKVNIRHCHIGVSRDIHYIIVSQYMKVSI